MFNSFSEFEPNFFDDAIRLKRDPYKVYITIENEKKNVNSPSIEEGMKMEENINPPSQITIVKACRCKARKPATNPETPQEMVPKPPEENVPDIPKMEVPKYPPAEQEIWKPMDDLHKDLGPQTKHPDIYQPIHGRINIDKHLEFSQPEKDIWALNSEELESGTYAKPSSIPDYHTSVGMLNPSQFIEPAYQKKTAGHDYYQHYQAPQHEGLPTNPFSFITGDLTQQDLREMEIIERIKENHDLNHSGSDYDHKRRIKEAVLDYIKSKYYTLGNKKHIISHSP